MLVIIKKVLILFNSIIRFLVAYLVSRFIKKSVILIGSGYGEYYDDNAIALFDYIQSAGGEIYLVTNRVKNIKTQLKRNEFKTYLYYFQSKCVFYTHSLSDVLPNMHRVWALINLLDPPKLIFLQHGVIGLKKNINSTITTKDYIVGLSKTFDLMIVSSILEKNIVAEFGIDKNKIAVTGLPRFDKLKTEHVDSIMVFFTWSHVESYQEKLNALKATNGYSRLLQNNYKIKIILHPMLSKLSAAEQRDTHESIHEVINQSGLLITDDSSVAWDFFYKNSQVIFYRPSNDWIIKNDPTLYKCVANNDEKFDLLVDGFLAQSDQLTYKFTGRQRDKDNCKRVFQLISNQ